MTFMSLLWAIAFGICPQRPSHSLFLGGQQMPIEARMAGMFAGFIIGAVLSAAEAFPIIAEVAHPNVKVCFDLYHLQLSEGNLTNNLKLGLEKGWIRLVQIGDVPGRKEPGTGEVNHPHIFRTLRQLGYSGYLDTEHGTTSTPEKAIEIVRRLTFEN